MAPLKTQPTDARVSDFIDAISDERMRSDCRALAHLMKSTTKSEPRLWGSAIVGFGTHEFRYASGRGGTWFLLGFSPRKSALTIYLMSGLDAHAKTLSRLGKFKTGKGCLYVRRLADVDSSALRELLSESVARVKARSPNAGS